jgi:hypothetical protein
MRKIRINNKTKKQFVLGISTIKKKNTDIKNTYRDILKIALQKKKRILKSHIFLMSSC